MPGKPPRRKAKPRAPSSVAWRFDADGDVIMTGTEDAGPEATYPADQDGDVVMADVWNLGSRVVWEVDADGDAIMTGC